MVAAIIFPVAAANVVGKGFTCFGVNVTRKGFVAVLTFGAFKTALNACVGLQGETVGLGHWVVGHWFIG